MDNKAYEAGDNGIRHREGVGQDIAPTQQRRKEKVKLKRNVGIIGGTSYIVGSVVGSGIFISPKGVLQETGSVGLSLCVWAAGGILSLCGALGYAELGTMITKSGGEYPYINAGLGKILAFLFAWTKIIVLTPTAVTIICLTFAEYTATFFEYCGTPSIPVKLVAALAILTLTIINCYDTKLATSVQVFFTFAKLLALGIIIVGGIVWLARGETATISTGFSGTTTQASGIAYAFFDALWAYDGWNTLNYVTEELKNPYVNLPRANVIGLVLVTVLYILTNISYLVVLGIDGLLASPAVAVTWGEAVLGKAGIIMPIFVMCSTFGAANGAMFAGVRTLYAAAREQQFPEILSYVSVNLYTPVPCIIFTCILSLIALIPGDIGTLIDFFSFAAWLFYALTIISLIVLRFTMKEANRPIKIFVGVPIVFLLCSLYLVIAPIILDPQLEILYAFLFVIAGLVLYIPLGHFRIHRGCFDPLTRLLQKCMNVVPSPYEPDVAD